MTDYTREQVGLLPLPLGTLLVERLAYAVQREFSPSFLAEMDAAPEIRTAVFEDALGSMIVQLRADVLAEKLAEETFTVSFKEPVYFFVPTSWWQMLKRNHFPRWWLRRWPHKETHITKFARGTREVSVQQFALFPFSPLRTPEKLRGSRVVRYERASVNS